MILGSDQIVAGLNSGRIICEPPPARIEGSHIDITLGDWVWVAELNGKEYIDLRTADATEHFHLFHQFDGLVEFPARSFVLAHTMEFIGSAPGSGLLPVLHTRSTFARWGLTVHLSAGLGDIGFASRWTLEIINPHDCDIAIPVGARIGCILFHEVAGAAIDYEVGTRYNIERKVWTPYAMLPRPANW